jgi:hypothetical protein
MLPENDPPHIRVSLLYPPGIWEFTQHGEMVRTSAARGTACCTIRGGPGLYWRTREEELPTPGVGSLAGDAGEGVF